MAPASTDGVLCAALSEKGLLQEMSPFSVQGHPPPKVGARAVQEHQADSARAKSTDANPSSETHFCPSWRFP